MKTLILNAWGQDNCLSFTLHEYTNGNLCVQAWVHQDEFIEPYSTITVNLGIECPKGFSFIDANNNHGIIGWLEANNLGKRTYITQVSGFCEYEMFKFNMEELEKYVHSDERRN